MPYVLLLNGQLCLWLDGSYQRNWQRVQLIPQCFSVYSSASAAGSTLEEPGSPRVLSLPQCPEAGPFERSSHRRQGQVSRHWSMPRKQQKGCMFCIYIKPCICWKQLSRLFFPCSFSLLVFQLYPLAFICLLIFDLPRPPLLPLSCPFLPHLERPSSSSTLQLTLLPWFLFCVFLPFMGRLY